MFFRKRMIYLLLVVAMMCSCVSRKQLAYFQSVTAESAEEINKYTHPQPEPFVKPATCSLPKIGKSMSPCESTV